ncbi:hypothetical protein KA036_00355 [Candidatus Gracilibacteria bacterium]|nr:hypothetical protein [Candidatus Gracilibacteria bacterium]
MANGLQDREGLVSGANLVCTDTIVVPELPIPEVRIPNVAIPNALKFPNITAPTVGLLSVAQVEQEMAINAANLPNLSDFVAYDSPETRIRDDALRLSEVSGGFVVDVAIVNPWLLVAPEHARYIDSICKIRPREEWGLNCDQAVPCNLVSFFVDEETGVVEPLGAKFAMVRLAAQKLQGDLGQDPLARKLCRINKVGCDIGYWLDLSSKFLAEQQSGFSKSDRFSPALRCGKVIRIVRKQLGLPDCNPDLVPYLDLRRESINRRVVGKSPNKPVEAVVEEPRGAVQPLFMIRQLEKKMLSFSGSSDFAGYENFVRKEIAKILASLGKINKEVQIKCKRDKKWEVGLIVGCNPFLGRGANKFVALNQALAGFINSQR